MAGILAFLFEVVRTAFQIPAAQHAKETQNANRTILQIVVTPVIGVSICMKEESIQSVQMKTYAVEGARGQTPNQIMMPSTHRMVREHQSIKLLSALLI